MMLLDCKVWSAKGSATFTLWSILFSGKFSTANFFFVSYSFNSIVWSAIYIRRSPSYSAKQIFIFPFFYNYRKFAKGKENCTNIARESCEGICDFITKDEYNPFCGNTIDPADTSNLFGKLTD